MLMIDVYLHGSKDAMRDAGETAGLTETALEEFVYALNEVKIGLVVDEQTGLAKIVMVDGRAVLNG